MARKGDTGTQNQASASKSEALSVPPPFSWYAGNIPQPLLKQGVKWLGEGFRGCLSKSVWDLVHQLGDLSLLAIHKLFPSCSLMYKQGRWMINRVAWFRKKEEKKRKQRMKAPRCPLKFAFHTSVDYFFSIHIPHVIFGAYLHKKLFLSIWESSPAGCPVLSTALIAELRLCEGLGTVTAEVPWVRVGLGKPTGGLQSW